MTNSEKEVEEMFGSNNEVGYVAADAILTVVVYSVVFFALGFIVGKLL